jgi:hypothetical protein
MRFVTWLHPNLPSKGNKMMRAVLYRVLLMVLVASFAGQAWAAAAKNKPKRYWSGGVVPVVIDPSISHPEEIQKAMRAWEASGIRFPVRTTERDYVVFTLSPNAQKASVDTRDEVEPDVDQDEQEMGGAVSAVGRIGGRQQIVASSDDVPWWRWAHEIGHCLGLYHEQIRTDRDRWVTIHWDNIPPAARHNFKIKPRKTVDIGPFDIESIMLYKWNMNAVDPQKPTMSWNADPAFHNFGAPVLQKLSKGDIAAVRHLYFEGGIQSLAHRRR